MSDDIWRHDEAPGGSTGRGGRKPGRFESAMDEFDEDEFGGPLFGDDSGGVANQETGDQPTVTRSPGGDRGDGAISFGDDDTGSLPHWTEPPTGEMPKIETPRDDEAATDDLDVWSTFTSESPVWQEGDAVDAPSGSSPASSATVVVGGDEAIDTTGELTWGDDPSDGADAMAPVPVGDEVSIEAAGPAREPARITIGTDPSGMPRRPAPGGRGGVPQRPPSALGAPVGGDSRNLPVAIATGLFLAAAFLALTIFVGPLGSLVFAVVALGLGGIEYFGKVTEKGYRPAVAPGVLAIIAAPLAAYWLHEFALPLVIAFAFGASALGFIGANSIESGPMPNMAITMLGIVWIGVLGSYAGMILDWSNLAEQFGSSEAGTSWGTDTFVLLAVGVVANDVGAYFVGKAFGRTPLRGWISPGKSVEGFLGGTILTLIVMLIVGLQGWSDTWSDTGHLLMLGIVISLFAPLGDLTASMFKRNLDVKDFGTIIRGHGGILDRFDGFLFTLPAVYYLFRVVTPQCAGLELPVCPF